MGMFGFNMQGGSSSKNKADSLGDQPFAGFSFNKDEDSLDDVRHG